MKKNMPVQVRHEKGEAVCDGNTKAMVPPPPHQWWLKETTASDEIVYYKYYSACWVFPQRCVCFVPKRGREEVKESYGFHEKSIAVAGRSEWCRKACIW